MKKALETLKTYIDGEGKEVLITSMDNIKGKRAMFYGDNGRGYYGNGACIEYHGIYDFDTVLKFNLVELKDTTNSRNNQVGGEHYKKHSIQPWDIIKDWKLDFIEGNVVKYMLRDKGSKKEDLKKACHYLQEILECIKVVPERTFINNDILLEDVIDEYCKPNQMEGDEVRHFYMAIKTNDLMIYKTYLEMCLHELKILIKCYNDYE